MEYQQVIEIFINCMIPWFYKKKQQNSHQIFGRVIAIAPVHEEHGRKTLQLHWQICVEELSHQICEDLWNADMNIKKREAVFVMLKLLCSQMQRL